MSINLEGELVVSEVDYLDLLRSWLAAQECCQLLVRARPPRLGSAS